MLQVKKTIISFCVKQNQHYLPSVLVTIFILKINITLFFLFINLTHVYEQSSHHDNQQLINLRRKKNIFEQEYYTVKKVHEFPVSSRDITNQTPPGLE